MDKQHFYAVVVIIVLVLTVTGGEAKPPVVKKDFRNVRWGMTRLEVMASEENAPEVFGLNSILYKPEIEGREFHLNYEFIENKLADAKYFFIAHTHSEYLWLKQMVSVKYGPPSTSHNGGYENFEYKWKDNITEIVLKPGRKRECIVHYKGLKYLYLKDVRAEIVTLKKEKNVKKTF